MHKGIIMLTKAESKEEALENVREFLPTYGNGDVRDRYQIGGRWTSKLSPFHKQFSDESDKLLGDGDFVSQKSIDENMDKLTEIWKGLGAVGNHPYSNHYSLPEDGGYYDVMELKDCIEIVKEYKGNPEERAEEFWEKMLAAKKEEKENQSEYRMSSAYAKWYADAKDKAFCFDTNVYNIEEDASEEIPEDIEGYRAVMIDIHN